MSQFRVLLALIFSLFLLAACSSSDDDVESTLPPPPPPPEPTYQAEITRTEYGIPHIVAEDWGGLGYGHGYAFAQDNYCMLVEEVIRAAGQSLELLGESQGSESTDFVFSLVNDNSDGQLEEKYLSKQPQYVRDMVDGYVAGYNRYLQETGVENLPEGDRGCRNASWVREINSVDLWKYFRRIQLQASTDQGIVRGAILAATGPESDAGLPAAVQEIEPTKLEALRKAFANTDLGSNAISLGRDATQNGSGMLLGNPHQPWYGVGSFYQVHLTIPGEYDVMGAALKGFPMIAIGFNRDLAWTHTVSFANRFTLFELALNPDNPLQYEVDGVMKDIVPETVEIKVTKEDGSVETRSHTFYHWEHGLIVDLADATGGLIGGWPTAAGTVYGMRDANIDNLRGIDMWVKLGQSLTISDLADALSLIGNPLFHTLAADRSGDMFYGEISSIPNVTQAQLDDCVIGTNALVYGFTNGAIVALDGARSECQWGNDPDGPPNSGLYGYDNLPKILGTNYALNSNDSYWLSDANNPLEGFPTLMGFLGGEGKQQSLRTQIGHEMVAARLAGTDGFDPSPKFTLASLQDLMYDNRVYGADISLSDVLALCAALAEIPAPGPTDQEQAALRACVPLATWDGKANTDSVGTQVYTEFWRRMESGGTGFTAGIEDAALWRVDFNPAEPLTTPRGFDTDQAEIRDRIIAGLAEAESSLVNAGVPLDAPWGQVQYVQFDGFTAPIHGGSGSMGVFGAIGGGLRTGGYNGIGSGNSYIQTVTWDDTECPVAEAIIVHSQSINPESPHHSDQTLLYSDKQWVDMPFCADEISAEMIGEPMTLVSED